MRVNIRSVDSENDEGVYNQKGKSMTVEAEKYEVVAVGKGITILATVEETRGNGRRGGEQKTTVRRLTMNLDKNDVPKFLRAINSAGPWLEDGGRNSALAWCDRPNPESIEGIARKNAQFRSIGGAMSGLGMTPPHARRSAIMRVSVACHVL